MKAKSARPRILAAFPFSDTEVVLISSDPVDASLMDPTLYRLASGSAVTDVQIDTNTPTRIVVTVEPHSVWPLATDTVTIRRFRSTGSARGLRAISPAFVRGVHDAFELKVSHFDDAFPYQSDLVGMHVSVACCTGCNGGIHDRNLVVLNHHIGGSWSGIWVQTGKPLEAPYPRWQKVLCAGGVLAEVNGSLTVVDRGWMEIRKLPETPHHAPPPLPIQTRDLPLERTESLVAKSFDGAWIELQDLVVQSATFIDAEPRVPGAVNLPRLEVTLTDRSRGTSKACLYHESARKLKPGDTVKQLRGFVHAEQPGVYVVLSDKDEDIFL